MPASFRVFRQPPLKLLIHALALSIAVSFSPARALSLQRDVSTKTARRIPSWVRDGVIYEIFPRAFSTQGNLNGITAKLDDLKSLGVTILWLMPIHPMGQEKKKGSVGSPYAVRDYYAINPDYGTKADLRRLITEAHRRGLRVIIDIVANHTAWDSVMMKSPAFYARDARGRVVSPHDWTDVAKLNYDTPALRDYMTRMLEYWLREFDLDGFRCDVAGEVPTSFWEQARIRLEKIKPDLLMLAEADNPELLVNAFDLDYAWKFHSALTDILFGQKPASVLREIWQQERKEFPKGALHMRFTDNHDERRAIARFGERGALAASALVFTLDGVPLLYNGMEAGDTTESGAPALFERQRIFWQIAERRPEFQHFYEQMIALRHAHQALRDGDTIWLRNSDEARVVTFARRSATEEILVAINLSNRPFIGDIEAAGRERFTDITPAIYSTSEKVRSTDAVASPTLTLDAWGFRILRRAL